MIKTCRINHITIETLDIERQLDYYQRVMGLHLTARDSECAYLATKVGELAVVLRPGSAPRCARLSFQIAPEVELAEAQRQLAAEGVQAEWRHSSQPGLDETLTFTDLNGNEVELISQPQFLPIKETTGISPFKLGHVAFIVADPLATAKFYESVLGFRVSDWVDQYFVFMRCGPDHHTVNFLKSERPRMHHLAFELRDAAHLTESCDVLGREKLEIVWGPVRHGPGHNIATYHLNTDNLMVELFVELDRMSDEALGHFDPRPWHEDRPQRPKKWGGRQRRDVWGPAIPTNFLLQGY